MRIFISIDIPKEIKDYLFNLQKTFPRNLAKIKFVAKKNLHLTLKFFPNINEEQLKIIKEKLQQLKFKPIKATLGKLGTFNKGSFGIVLWIDLDSKEIYNLQDDIDILLQPEFKRENRFHTHLTLGRIKHVKNKEPFLDFLKTVKIQSLNFKIEKINLIQSNLTKDGPKYKILNLS